MVERTEGSHHSEKRDKLIVEVGTRLDPVFKIGQREISPDEFFVAINEYADTAMKLKSAVGKRDDFVSIVGDAVNLQLPEESVDELIFSNVFGDPRSVRFRADAEGKTFKEMLVAYMQEISRVLKPGGKATITESSFTPAFEDLGIYFDHPRPGPIMAFELRAILNKLNLKAEYISQSDADIKKYDKQYDGSPPGFQLILRKTV